MTIQDQITVSFADDKTLDESSIRSVRGMIGVYFIFLAELRIPYPFHSSRLIYIGMSESRQNSIGNRLRDHESGQSGNPGLTNFISSKEGRFAYHSLDFLRVLGSTNVAEFEGLFLRSFLAFHGCYPICNNQAGIEACTAMNVKNISVDWSFFR